MEQAFPIFMDAQPAQGESEADAGIPSDAGMEIVPDAGMFQISLNEALATLPRESTTAQTSVQDLAVAPAALPALPVISEPVEISISGGKEGPTPLTWENGCQVGLSLEPAARPGAYTFTPTDFAAESIAVKTDANPVPLPETKPVGIQVATPVAPQSFVVPLSFQPIAPQRVPVQSEPVMTTPDGIPTQPLVPPGLVKPMERETIPVAPGLPPVQTVPVSEPSKITVNGPSKPVRETLIPSPARDPIEIPAPTPEMRINISRPLRFDTEIREPQPVVTHPKAPIPSVPATPAPVSMALGDAELPEGDTEQGEQPDVEITKPVPVQKGTGSQFDFSGNERFSGRRESARPEAEPLPEWEISLRAETGRPDSLADRHPFAETLKSPEPGAPVVFRAPLPQLPAALFQRLVETTGEMVRAESSRQEFVVQVEPENLGRVQVAVEMHHGRIAARIAVDSDAVRQAMDAQLPALKLALEQQGLRLESIEVSVQDRHASLFNPEGRDSESFFHQRRANGKPGMETPGMESESDPAIGETGRRFGFNTVEYFA